MSEDNDLENEPLIPTPYQGMHRRNLEDDEPATPIPDPEPDPDDIEEKTFKKRYGDLRKHHDETVKNLKKEMDQLKKEFQENTSIRWTPPKSEAELEAFRAEHPEAFEIFESIAYRRVSEELKKLDELKAKLEEKEEETAREKAKSVILKDHPDFDEIVVSEEFHNWLADQPDQIQEWAYNNATDGRLASKVLTMYKIETGQGTKPKKQTLKADAARLVDPKGSKLDPASNGKRTFKASEIAKMSLNEYEALEAEILAAKREGRITQN